MIFLPNNVHHLDSYLWHLAQIIIYNLYQCPCHMAEPLAIEKTLECTHVTHPILACCLLPVFLLLFPFIFWSYCSPSWSYCYWSPGLHQYQVYTQCPVWAHPTVQVCRSKPVPSNLRSKVLPQGWIATFWNHQIYLHNLSRVFKPWHLVFDDKWNDFTVLTIPVAGSAMVAQYTFVPGLRYRPWQPQLWGQIRDVIWIQAFVGCRPLGLGLGLGPLDS